MLDFLMIISKVHLYILYVWQTTECISHEAVSLTDVQWKAVWEVNSLGWLYDIQLGEEVSSMSASCMTMQRSSLS